MNRWRTVSAILLVSISILASVEVYQVLATPAPSRSSTIEPGSLSKGARFVFYVDGSTYLANNAQTGVNDCSSTTFSTVWNCAKANPGVFFFQSGTYTVDTTLLVPNGIIVKGDGIQQVSFTAANNLNANLFNVTGSNVAFEDLTVNGNSAQQTKGTCISFYPSSNQNEALVQNVQVTLCKTNGIDAGVGPSMATYKNIHIRSSNINNNGNNNIKFGANSDDSSVDTSLISSASSNSVALSSTSGITIGPANQIYQSCGDGVNVASSSSYIITSNFINNNANAGIRLVTAANNVTVSDNVIVGNSFSSGLPAGCAPCGSQCSPGILVIDSAKGIIITGNFVTGTTQSYALTLTGTSNFISAEANNFQGNGIGAINPVGNNNYFADDLGYNPAPRSVTAGANPFTFTDTDGYREEIQITTLAGMTGWTCRGDTMINVVNEISPILNPVAGDSCVLTWVTTAPVFEVLPTVS